MATSTVNTKKAQARVSALVQRSPMLEKKRTIQAVIAPPAYSGHPPRPPFSGKAAWGEFACRDASETSQEKKQFCSNYNLEGEEHAHGKFAVLNRFFLNRFTRDLVEKGI